MNVSRRTFLGVVATIAFAAAIAGAAHAADPGFVNLFDGCTSLTGESPYTVVNGVKYHLYERTSANSEASGFKAVTAHDFAFRGCTGLSDYSKIDGTWK